MWFFKLELLYYDRVWGLGITLPSFFIADHPAMIELMCALRTNVADYPAINDIFFERMQITLPSLIFCDQMRIILPLFGALWTLICMLTLQWVKTLHMLWTKCGIALPSLICYEWNVDCPAIIDMLWPKCWLPSQHWHVVNEWGLTLIAPAGVHKGHTFF